ncbi:MAG: acyl-CoA dehydrogenase, partial [Gammaproteobacteria bacterium]|nr:acyl-CoA dehydrogenase [Gammaproteobacteria bacterium]
VTEWGLEQFVRDARIAQIYEGTNGIQAMDLTDRKTARDGGRMAGLFADRVAAFLADGPCPERLRPGLQVALEAFRRSTAFIVEHSAEDPAVAGSAACDYLELTGLLGYGWLWAWMVGVAEAGLEADGADVDLLQGKVATGDFFHARLLPMAATLEQRITSGSTVVMALAEDQF